MADRQLIPSLLFLGLRLTWKCNIKRPVRLAVINWVPYLLRTNLIPVDRTYYISHAFFNNGSKQRYLIICSLGHFIECANTKWLPQVPGCWPAVWVGTWVQVPCEEKNKNKKMLRRLERPLQIQASRFSKDPWAVLPFRSNILHTADFHPYISPYDCRKALPRKLQLHSHKLHYSTYMQAPTTKVVENKKRCVEV